LIVAIDAGAAAGKSSVGRRVAEALGLPFVDSGLMYRAIAVLAAELGLDPEDEGATGRLARATPIRVQGKQVWAGGRELTDRVYDAGLTPLLTRIARTAAVREALVEQQRAMAAPSLVMAGRDIGTVVFPEADFKFFLVASLEERVRRRAAQYADRGETADPQTMAKEVAERDRADSEREVAPLRPAPDALVVRTDDLDLEDVVRLIVDRIRPAQR